MQNVCYRGAGRKSLPDFDCGCDGRFCGEGRSDADLPASGSCPLTRTGAQYVIGAKGFAEQYILASLIDQRLANAGLHAVTRSNLGSAVIFDALAAGDVDVYVDYTGTLWTNTMHRSDAPPRHHRPRACGPARSGWGSPPRSASR